ncbi:MAG: Na/Pi symporter [Bacteroidales bacterium]|nr:Na/Pi symporter [Bacteroidales bacterium]
MHRDGVPVPEGWSPLSNISKINPIFEAIMNFDIWMLIAGIGIFLFGIYLMEESLKALSGKAFKSFIRKYTSTPIKAIATGTLSTGILQSSSAVTLMVLAFVGAGIMTLSNAFGVILGSNLGTTLTSWIVATVGFKVDIESFALPFIGIGGLGLIFLGRSSRMSNISKLLVGFGFLFLGLNYMKVSVEEFTALFDLSDFKDYHLLVFVLLGFIITAVMQSSSAAVAIILTAVYGNAIDFFTASAMVIGTNMGTTVTVLIGSFGGPVAKKQVAMCHVIFNLITGIVAIVFLKPLNYVVLDVFSLKNDPVMALALFHTLFNALGVILFFPFLRIIASFITRLIKDKKVHLSQYVSNATAEVPEAALVAMKNESAYLIRLVMAHNLKLLHIDTKLVLSQAQTSSDPVFSRTYDKIYSVIKSVQSEIFLFSSKLQTQPLTKDESLRLNKKLHSVRYGVSSAKTLKDIAHELEKMDQSDLPAMTRKHQEFRKKMMHFYMIFDELLENRDSEVNLPRLTELMQKMRDDEQNSIQETGDFISSAGLGEAEISTLLSASRSFTLSLRQLALSVKDLVLTTEQSEIYDNTI